MPHTAVFAGAVLFERQFLNKLNIGGTQLMLLQDWDQITEDLPQLCLASLLDLCFCKTVNQINNRGSAPALLEVCFCETENQITEDLPQLCLLSEALRKKNWRDFGSMSQKFYEGVMDVQSTTAYIDGDWAIVNKKQGQE
ncbi:hypothetical protein PoB_004993600 [Plakobranchus ocellatus]|uniref:Uncharacterized protein n=1 Tax=Plakobranchus ocellatus TaxID=259542 RepID=A0AAV4BWF2_9GAST|nr:hypothetical protein PoB_004993600 [Plakobranchus ocellatus]